MWTRTLISILALTIAGLLSPNDCRAESTDDQVGATIVLDLSGAKTKSGRSVRYRRPVRFLVKNVNRFVYDVELSYESRTFSSAEVPDIFTSKLMPSKPAPPPPPGAELVSVGFPKALAHFNATLRKLLDITELDEELVNLALSHPELGATTAQTIMAKASNLVQKSTGDVAGESISRVGNERFDQTREAYENLHDAFDAIMAPMTPTPAQRRQFTEAGERWERLRVANETLESTGPGAARSMLAAEFFHAAQVYGFITDGSAFQAILIIPQAKGDEMKLKYKITANDRYPSSSKPKPIEDDIALDVVDRLAIDFSGGTFFSKVVDNEFFVQSKTEPDPADPMEEITKRIVRSQGSNDVNTLLGGLTHVYWKFGSPVIPALSLGAALNGETVQYLIGGSLLFGSERRFILTVGVAGSPVKRLQPGLRVNQEIPDDRGEITRSKFKTGLFLGLSYNL